MLGAIAGDVIGSIYERSPIKTTDFPLFQPTCRFTDDTVMTVATAYAILEQVDYAASFKQFGRKYPHAGYGGTFIDWIFQPDVQPYYSWGNGSAMRVSPIGLAFDQVETVLAEAQRSAEVSHNHPEGIKGAQATALAVYLARRGESKEQIRQEITERFGYNLDRTLAEIRLVYQFDVSCQGSVPEAIIAFLEADSYEDAVRKAVSLGGDSDTLACIAGGIAQAFYKEIPQEIVSRVREVLPEEFLRIVDKFNHTYGRMILQIRAATPADEPFLWEMLFHAIYVPKGQPPASRSIVFEPELSRYVQGWGQPDDVGFVAWDGEKPVGAVWLRLLNGENKGFGYVDETTPELSIAVLPAYRGQGIGTSLLGHLLEVVQARYPAICLSVSPDNPAQRLYQGFGFEVVGASGASLTLVKR